ncbi:hypothetical protein Tco_0879902 [Tanacetum coccineum]
MFLNSLQSEWSKYVIMARQYPNLLNVDYDVLYHHLKQHEVTMNALQAKRAAKAHHLLALFFAVFTILLFVVRFLLTPNSHSRPPQDYYVTRPSFVNEFDDSQSYDIQGENQAYVQNGIVDVQIKNVGNVELLEEILGGTPRTIANSGNSPIVQCYNCNEKEDEAWINLNDEENDFLLADVPEDEIKELNATCIVMARIQSVINDPDIDPEFVNEVHTSESCFMDTIFSNYDHEKSQHVQHETFKPSYDDDQIDSSIIFDDSDGEGNTEIIENDTIAQDQHRAKMEDLMKSVQLEAEKTHKINAEVKKADAFLTKELEEYKERVWEYTTKLKEMLNIFESMGIELLETTKENDFLKIVLGRLLKASLADTVRDILMHSYMEIQNDNLRKAVVRITKESNDIQQNLLKRIVILEMTSNGIKHKVLISN